MTLFSAAMSKILSHRRKLITGAGVAAAVSSLWLGGPGFENDLRSLRNRVLSHDASGEVHIVEMDAASIEAIARWPWPRGVHGQAVERLLNSGVKSIAFDVDFSARSTPGEDAKFAGALAKGQGSVVLATMVQQAGSGRAGWIENMPIPLLREHAFVAAVNIIPGYDGYVRSAPLGVVIGGAPRPSLPAMVAEVAASSNEDFIIDYAIRPQSVPRHSFIDLIDGRVSASALRGKRIIIGATAIEMGDRYAVPGHGVIPGVVIQALAAETLMAGRPTDTGFLAALLIAAGGIALLAGRAPRAIRVIGFVAAGAVVFAFPLALEQWFSASADIVPALAALLATGTAAGIATMVRNFRRRTMIDAQTGLPNLNAFAESLERERGTLVAVAYIAEFSATASACGTAITADLVRRVSERIASTTRGRSVYRVDEATLAWSADPQDVDDMGARFDVLAGLMRAPIEAGGRRIDVALDFGVAPGRGPEARQLVADATLAASNAAKSGQRWQLFTLGNEEDAQWRLSLLGELDAALARGDIWVAHQAKFDLRTRRVLGSEALVRWQHPIRGPIPPDLFIPAVEAQGRIYELTMHVLRTALSDAAAWRDDQAPMTTAVNISVTLLTQPGFVEDIQGALDRSGLPATALTLEVTESAAMTSSDEAVRTLERLRGLGIKLSVDDYGTGQSTLTYLKRLPASELKIDKSFIQTIVANRNDAILVRSTIDLAHELGLSVVGEGVEDAECMEALAALGCDAVQGYHIGRPMPTGDFLKLAKRFNAPARSVPPIDVAA